MAGWTLGSFARAGTMGGGRSRLTGTNVTGVDDTGAPAPTGATKMPPIKYGATAATAGGPTMTAGQGSPLTMDASATGAPAGTPRMPAPGGNRLQSFFGDRFGGAQQAMSLFGGAARDPLAGKRDYDPSTPGIQGPMGQTRTGGGLHGQEANAAQQASYAQTLQAANAAGADLYAPAGPAGSLMTQIFSAGPSVKGQLSPQALAQVQQEAQAILQRANDQYNWSVQNASEAMRNDPNYMAGLERMKQSMSSAAQGWL